MNFLIEYTKRNVMFVVCWRFVVDFLFTQSHTIPHLFSKFINFVQLQQIDGFLIGNFRGWFDVIHACNWMLENELNVFE